MAIVQELAQDARDALRFLRRAPGFSLATISMLTLGIGLVAGAYSVINGLFLRPWPVPDADHVAMERNSLSVAAQRGERHLGRVPAAWFVSNNFVDVLGIRLQQGIGLAGVPVSGPKVLLSDALWRRRFNEEPGIVGRTI